MNPKFGIAVLLIAALVAVNAAAEEPRWDVGVRGGISSVGGIPANDIAGLGLIGRYRLGEGHYLGVAIEQLEFDFERPWRIVGVEQDKAVRSKDIDARTSSTVVSVFYERRYGGSKERWNTYWNVGLGFASPDADPATGPAVGGGNFIIVTDAGSEVIPSLGGGVRYNFTPKFAGDAGLSASRHIANWTVTDRVSGRTGKVDDYTRLGIQLGKH